MKRGVHLRHQVRRERINWIGEPSPISRHHNRSCRSLRAGRITRSPEYCHHPGRRHGLFGRALLRRRYRHAKPRPPGRQWSPIHPGILNGAVRPIPELPSDGAVRPAKRLRHHDSGEYSGLHAVPARVPEAAGIPHVPFGQVAHAIPAVGGHRLRPVVHHAG